MTRFVTLICLLLLNVMIFGQSGLELALPERSVMNNFEIHIRNFHADQIHSITGKKLTLNPDKIIFNGEVLNVKSFKTRGNTTLNYRRKSFSLSLIEPVDFLSSPIQRLAINNLAMDKNYWRARFCYLLMNTIDIFPLLNQYTELSINEKTQGTYLMIEKPEDYCRRLGSKLLIRREAGNRFHTEYMDGNLKAQVSQVKNISKLLKRQTGAFLYQSLNTIINLDDYFKWLAFNYLVLNGDYEDELFLFLDPETNIFGVIPWDYDDVFASTPHGGIQKRKHQEHKLLFSFESPIDLTIANDPFLYDAYLDRLQDVVTIITEETIKSTFEQVYQELAPFFTTPEIVAQSQYDQSGLTNIQNLETDLQNLYALLLDRRNSIANTLMLR